LGFYEQPKNALPGRKMKSSMETRIKKRFFFLFVAFLLGAGIASWLRQQPVAPALAAVVDPPRSWGFRITFGVRNHTAGRVWSGGVRNLAQVGSLEGWHFGAEDAIVPPNRWNITLELVGGEVASKAVILDLVSPEESPVTIFTRYGDFTFVPAAIPYGKVYPVETFNGDVTVDRVPLPQTVTGEAFEDDDPALLRTRSGEYWLAWVAYQTRQRNGYHYTGGDQILVARGRDGIHWNPPASITPAGDHFRVALGEDARGRIWCVYAEQKQLETGNFDLYARYFDGQNWSSEERLTDSPFPDIFHRMASDRNGNLYLVWMGYRVGAGGVPQSDILLRTFSTNRWGPELNVSQSPENDWEPAVSVDSSGRAWVAWDSYRPNGNDPATYDVLLRSYDPGALGPVQTVSATPFAEMRADVVVDRQDRVWVSWEEGGLNWGKDSGYENPNHRIWLKPGGSQIYGPPNSRTALYRRPRVAVFENGQWKEPRARLEDAWPESMQKNLYLSPRLGVDGNGHVWLFVRHQLIAQGRNGGQMFDYFATTLTGTDGEQHWLSPVLLPGSTGRQDTVLAAAPANEGIAVAVVGDGRHFPVPLPINHDVATLVLDSRGIPPAADEFKPFQPSSAGAYAVTHPEEARQVAAIRAHRLNIDGQRYKIVRGDVHRHTEISMDGAIDGSLWDLYRYAIDAAALDFVAVTDHNYGAWLDTDEPESNNTDNEFQWWRTQKSADLFYVPGRFVPLYGYERSVNFPLGHRNILHVHRGVFSYRVPKLFLSERPEWIERDAQGLWSYLRSTDGIALPHSTGTNMGTDWRLRDDQLEPVAELYSGDWGAFEELGQPRAATKDAVGGGFSGRAPFVNGLLWNALGVGYKLGFIASSDHWATHIAYANLLVPDRTTTRADLLAAFRQRRTYASTDNIILDFFAGSALQGSEIQASGSPTFEIRIRGTEPILRIELIKNNRVIYSRGGDPAPADPRVAEFSFRDNNTFADTRMASTQEIQNWDAPETGIRPRLQGQWAYYYVRVIQRFSSEFPEREGEIAWSSPIYVKQ
jgi:hypothetical protein